MVCLKKNTFCSTSKDDEIIILKGNSAEPVVIKLLDPESSEVIASVTKKSTKKSIVFKPCTELKEYIIAGGSYVLQIFHGADIHQMNMQMVL